MRFPSFVRAAVCALALVFSAGAVAQMGKTYTSTPGSKDDKDKAAATPAASRGRQYECSHDYGLQLKGREVVDPPKTPAPAPRKRR